MISTDATRIRMSKSTKGPLKKKTLRESEQNLPRREPRGPSWVECFLICLRRFHYVAQAGLLSTEIAPPQIHPFRGVYKMHTTLKQL